MLVIENGNKAVDCLQSYKDTFSAIKEVDVGSVLATLDLNGVHSLTDDALLEDLLQFQPNIRRLSLKNCRKITGKGLTTVAKYLPELTSFDVGGSFNINPSDVINMVRIHPGTAAGTLTEIHASGVGWTDELLDAFI